MTNKEKFVLEELSKESPMVISTAYIYAKNYVKYGCDITKAWNTAAQQAAILEQTKRDAYAEAYDSFRKDYENRLKNDLVAMVLEMQTEIENYKLSEEELSEMDEDSVKWGMAIVIGIIDKYKPESEEEDG